ncbi:MAG: response regulator [Nanoarchaeota archaeon]|nr:response regulator [Nanoarchaeota archaeon]
MKQRILFVEDHESQIEAIVRELKNEFEIVIARDGLKALKELDKSIEENNLYSLIVSDVEMPAFDGPSLLSILDQSITTFKQAELHNQLLGQESLISEFQKSSWGDEAFSLKNYESIIGTYGIGFNKVVASTDKEKAQDTAKRFQYVHIVKCAEDTENTVETIKNSLNKDVNAKSKTLDLIKIENRQNYSFFTELVEKTRELEKMYHTIKGSAAMIELDYIPGPLHLIEKETEELRKKVYNLDNLLKTADLNDSKAIISGIAKNLYDNNKEAIEKNNLFGILDELLNNDHDTLVKIRNLDAKISQRGVNILKEEVKEYKEIINDCMNYFKTTAE